MFIRILYSIGTIAFILWSLSFITFFILFPFNKHFCFMVVSAVFCSHLYKHILLVIFSLIIFRCKNSSISWLMQTFYVFVMYFFWTLSFIRWFLEMFVVFLTSCLFFMTIFITIEHIFLWKESVGLLHLFVSLFLFFVFLFSHCTS